MLIIIFCITPNFDTLTGGDNHIGIVKDIVATSISESAPIGIVLDESRETITIIEGSNEIILGKQSIDFKIGDSDVVINGARVGQRPEDIINKKYRMA